MNDTRIEYPREGTRQESWINAISVVALFTVTYLLSLLLGQVSFSEAVALRPMNFAHLYAVLTYALGHVSVTHLLFNMIQLGTLTYFATTFKGPIEYWKVFLITMIGSGLFVFFTAPAGSMVIGASGITAGVAAWLFVRSAIPSMDVPVFSIASAFLALIGIGMVSTIQSGDTAVSWQAHAGGALVGLIYACLSILKQYRTP